MIELRLNKESVPFVLLPTKKSGDTYNFAKDANFDNYSLLVAAGGDGTYHEVVNGMLARKDGKKLPVAMLPNGSGNDTCSSIGVRTLDDALDYIVNAEVIALDTIQVLIDYEKKEDIPEDKMFTNYRHMLINSTLAMPGKIANWAAKYKKCCGKLSYTLATMESVFLCRLREDVFNIEADGVKV